MSEFFAFLGFSVLLICGTVAWKVLMKPARAAWGDWAVGVELLVTASGVVVTSLLTEGTPYAAARLLLLVALGLVILSVALVMNVCGYDDVGEMTKKGMMCLSITGGITLVMVYSINDHVAGAATLWHRLFG
ncbi:hypothetical protein ACFWP5_25015 [Streptomyces sp. NPDC058469]|uniref:hypothetical protein n=1 Tax=Streptomyces sp. NPDC058469 TaxID=3346514 RepID=UPI0036619D42